MPACSYSNNEGCKKLSTFSMQWLYVVEVDNADKHKYSFDCLWKKRRILGSVILLNKLRLVMSNDLLNHLKKYNVRSAVYVRTYNYYGKWHQF